MIVRALKCLVGFFGTWWHNVWKIGFYNSIELALFFSVFFLYFHCFVCRNNALPLAICAFL